MLVGTTGADVLNAGAGDDILIGAGGNDTLIGGSGNDSFVFTRGSGTDTISGFDAGAGSNDVIRLEDMGFSSFAQVKAAALQVGSDVQINLGSGDMLVLSGTPLANLHADDFIFG